MFEEDTAAFSDKNSVCDGFIYYRHALITNAQVIVNKVKSGEFIAYEPVSDELFKSVIAGLLSSKDTALKIKNFYMTGLWHNLT